MMLAILHLLNVKDLCREDILRHQQSIVNHPDTNPVGGSPRLISFVQLKDMLAAYRSQIQGVTYIFSCLQYSYALGLTCKIFGCLKCVCLLKEIDMGAPASVSLPFNTQASILKDSGSLQTCISGREQSEGLLLRNIEHNLILTPHLR